MERPREHERKIPTILFVVDDNDADDVVDMYTTHTVTHTDIYAHGYDTDSLKCRRRSSSCSRESGREMDIVRRGIEERRDDG